MGYEIKYIWYVILKWLCFKVWENVYTFGQNFHVIFLDDMSLLFTKSNQKCVLLLQRYLFLTKKIEKQICVFPCNIFEWYEFNILKIKSKMCINFTKISVSYTNNYKKNMSFIFERYGVFYQQKDIPNPVE